MTREEIEQLETADRNPREGLWDAEKVIKWLQDNADSYTWYNEFEGESGMTDDFIEDLQKSNGGLNHEYKRCHIK